MNNKEKIIKSFGKVRDDLDEVISNLQQLDSGDKKTDRLATNRITFAMFSVVDRLIDTEAKLYNYLKRRQDNGLCIKKESKRGTREHK